MMEEGAVEGLDWSGDAFGGGFFGNLVSSCFEKCAWCSGVARNLIEDTRLLCNGNRMEDSDIYCPVICATGYKRFQQRIEV